jgi:hypothetical protein
MHRVWQFTMVVSVNVQLTRVEPAPTAPPSIVQFLRWLAGKPALIS